MQHRLFSVILFFLLGSFAFLEAQFFVPPQPLWNQFPNAQENLDYFYRRNIIVKNYSSHQLTLIIPYLINGKELEFDKSNSYNLPICGVNSDSLRMELFPLEKYSLFNLFYNPAVSHSKDDEAFVHFESEDQSMQLVSLQRPNVIFSDPHKEHYVRAVLKKYPDSFGPGSIIEISFFDYREYEGRKDSLWSAFKNLFSRSDAQQKMYDEADDDDRRYIL